MFSRSKLALTLLSVSLCSCAKPKEAITPPTEVQESVTQAESSTDQKDENEGTVKLSRTIREACGLSDSEAHFKFDSAVIRSADSGTLDKVAVCFISGPLAGEQMKLIGRADPRGGSEYNIVLGGSRSDNVKIYLVRHGMTADSISATSRGELDASGNDEAGWLQDRRVDVMLASEL